MVLGGLCTALSCNLRTCLAGMVTDARARAQRGLAMSRELAALLLNEGGDEAAGRVAGPALERGECHLLYARLL